MCRDSIRSGLGATPVGGAGPLDTLDEKTAQIVKSPTLATAKPPAEHTRQQQETVRAMNPHLAILLSPVILLAACGSSGQQNTVRLLNDRLQTQMASDIAANRAVVQSLPDGARVMLLEPSLFPNDADALDGRKYDVRASLIEGLLDPDLMRVQVADSSSLPDRQRDARVRNMVQYLVENGLASTLTPPETLQSSPAGLAVTIRVQCPDRQDGSGYGTGERKPDCS
jgi:hypothetical protein